MRIVILTLIALMFTSFELMAASQKPSNPIVISLQEISSSGEEGVHRLSISVYSLVAISELDVQVEVPSTMELLDGQLSWQGSVSKLHPANFEFTGRFGDTSEKLIIVTAKSNNAALARQAQTQYELGSQTKLLTPKKANHKAGEIIYQDERRMRVIPLEQN